jgi:hypothetical protein
MNNEPVGYFGKDPYGNWEELNEKHGIPLYTHPAELTDEEILSCWHEYGQILTIQQIRIHFARAILRKASEK